MSYTNEFIKEIAKKVAPKFSTVTSFRMMMEGYGAHGDLLEQCVEIWKQNKGVTSRGKK